VSRQPLLHEVVCAWCLGRAVCFISRSSTFLCTRCEDCGALSVLRDHRTPWVWVPRKRRATDSPVA
jgi:hypothetical protein